MTDSKPIGPEIVFDCEFAGIHIDNQTRVLSFSFIFTPEEMESDLNSEERIAFWNLGQDQSIRITIQRVEE